MTMAGLAPRPVSGDELIGNVIQNQFFQARDWPFGAALGMVFLLLFVASYGLWLRQRERSVEGF